MKFKNPELDVLTKLYAFLHLLIDKMRTLKNYGVVGVQSFYQKRGFEVIRGHLRSIEIAIKKRTLDYDNF